MGASDAVVAVLLATLSVTIFIVTNSYPEPLVPGEPGPALFPRLLAGVLFALAVLLFGQGLRKQVTTRDVKRRRISRPVGALCLMVAFVAVVGYFDTFVLLPILLGSIMALMGERRPRMILVVTLSFDLFVYVVFYRIFHVMLPTVYF